MGRAVQRSAPTPTTRSTPTTATPTRCSARSTNYTEIDAFSEVIGKRYISEFYVQDTWKATRRLTFDYGVRFLWYTPWYSTQPAAVFVPERYDPAQGAAALSAGAHQQRQRRVRSGHRRRRCPTSSSARFVPGTGDRYNGMVSNGDPNYPKGFRDNQGIEPEPRLGLAWDLTGDGKTAMHASVGLYHNPHVNANGLDAMARNPPAQNTPSIIYGTMDTLLAAGAQGAFSNRPSDVFGIQRDAQTPKSYNYSVGIQRDIGWGTVLDVTYAGFQMRNGEMATSINTVPDGARFLDVNPQNAQSAEPDDGEAERVPAAVSRATRTSRSASTSATRLQLAAGAAQPPLHQRPAVRGRLHLRQDRSATAPAVTRLPTTPSGPATRGTYGPDQLDAAAQPRRQLHLGRAERQPACGTTALTRGAARRLAALRATRPWVSGDWSGASDLDDRQLRLHRRRRRNAAAISGDTLCTQRQLRPDAGRNRAATSTSPRSAG